MTKTTKIECATRVWNPIRGCSRKSAGRIGRVSLLKDKLGDPLRWRKPANIFVNSKSDLFHEDLSFEDIGSVFGVVLIGIRNGHTFQILTKRPERMKLWFEWIQNANEWGEDNWTRICRLAARRFEHGKWEKIIIEHGLEALDEFEDEPWPMPSVWIGVYVEDQRTAEQRIPILLQTPAALRFVSYEPALGPVDFRRYLPTPFNDGLDWIIVGGESGPRARACDVAWLRSAVTQCRAAGVPVFVTQLGARPFDGEEPDHNPNGADEPRWLRLRDRKGGAPSEWPDDLRVREFPR